MLAAGIWDRVTPIFSPKGKPGTIVRFARPASALVVFALIAGAYYHCNGQAQAADASAKNPKLNGASTAFEKCMSDPTLLLVVWFVTFGASHASPAHPFPWPAFTPIVPTPVPQELLPFGRSPSSL